jgi:hypothetical protein
MAEFTCTGAAKIRIHGGMIGIVGGDINTFSKVFTLTYSTVEAEVIKGFKSVVDNPTKFEGGPFTDLLTEFEQGLGWEPAGGLPGGFEGGLPSKGEAIEIKA